MQLASSGQSSGIDWAVIIAAVIAAVASLSTLGVQIYGIRRVSKDTTGTVRDQLAQRREQLNRTLAQDELRTWNERFTAAADRLGHDRPAAVRLAAVYALAGLADDWPENRQTCVDVLCEYLRMPYEPDLGEQADPSRRLQFLADQQVRHTAMRLIADHLRPEAKTTWTGLDFNLTGAVFDGGAYDFRGADFSQGFVRFSRATFARGCKFDFGRAAFSGGTADFSRAVFSGGTVDFSRAVFSGSTLDFTRLALPDGLVDFTGAEFSGGTVRFDFANFSGGTLGFRDAKFSGGTLDFRDAKFSRGEAYFSRMAFSGGKVHFIDAVFSGSIFVFGTQFSGADAYFSRAAFSGSKVGFSDAVFSSSKVNFDLTDFSRGETYFSGAVFSGGEVDFSEVADWSHPPLFGTRATPLLGVKMPATAAGSPQ